MLYLYNNPRFSHARRSLRLACSSLTKLSAASALSERLTRSQLHEFEAFQFSLFALIHLCNLMFLRFCVFAFSQAVMPHLLSSFLYSSAGDDFWSPVTAILNWCEEITSFRRQTHAKLNQTNIGLLRDGIRRGDHQHVDEHLFRLSCSQGHPQLPTARPRPGMSGCIFQHAVHRHRQHSFPYDMNCKWASRKARTFQRLNSRQIGCSL